MNNKYLESSEFYNERFSNFSTLIIVPSLFVFIFVILFSIFATHETTIDSVGTVVDSGELQKIKTAKYSRIAENYMHEGQHVKKGDVLISLVDENGSKKIIRSSMDGILHLESEEYPSVLKSGTELATVYPNLVKGSVLKITSYVPSSDVSLIHRGQNERMTITKRMSKSIIVQGKIIDVGVVPIESKKGVLYEIHAKAKIKTNGDGIKYGMIGKTSIIVGKESFFNYYKEKLFNKD